MCWLAEAILPNFASLFLRLARVNVERKLQLNLNRGKVLIPLKASEGNILNLRILFWEPSFCLLSIEQVILARKRR
jgi:hypothetical protein